MMALESCPLDEGIHFKKGYVSFIDSFFGDLDNFANALGDHFGNYDCDLAMDLEIALDTIEFRLSLLPSDQKKDYWAGVQAGVTKSCQILHLAYETGDLKKSA